MVGLVREYEIAELAVQAALDAGARYADVRVMHRDQQMLSARNGDIEAVISSADSGIGVRALVGSGWGFYATADLDDAAVRAAGFWGDPPTMSSNQDRDR